MYSFNDIFYDARIKHICVHSERERGRKTDFMFPSSSSRGWREKETWSDCYYPVKWNENWKRTKGAKKGAVSFCIYEIDCDCDVDTQSSSSSLSKYNMLVRHKITLVYASTSRLSPVDWHKSDDSNACLSGFSKRNCPMSFSIRRRTINISISFKQIHAPN